VTKLYALILGAVVIIAIVLIYDFLDNFLD